MLATRENVAVVVEWKKNHPELPLVVDPVLFATAGPPLLEEDGRILLRDELLPGCTLVTPNLFESEFLTGARHSAADSAKSIYEAHGCSALIKGGHSEDQESEVVDVACLDGELVEFSHPRLPVPDLHGTGCTLSAAITAALAHGKPLVGAIEDATRYLERAMASHYIWPTLGAREEPDATGALNHFPNDVD